MKKIIKLKDLPVEQRLRIEIILDRNRRNASTLSIIDKEGLSLNDKGSHNTRTIIANKLEKIRQNELLNKIREEISKPKYSKLFNQN